MDYRKARKLSNIFSISGVVLIFSMLIVENILALLILFCAAGFALIGISAVIMFSYYRCPHCHAGLPFRTVSIPTFCPSCGEKLEK